MKTWEDATREEILEARVQSLEEGLQHLQDCVKQALEWTVSRSTLTRPEHVLDDEWSK